MLYSGATRSFVSLSFATPLEHSAGLLFGPLEIEISDDRTVIVLDARQGHVLEVPGEMFPLESQYLCGSCMSLLAWT